MLKISELTEDIKADLKSQLSKGRDLHVVSDDALDDLILIVSPTKAEYKRFTDFAAKGKEDKAQDALLGDCIAYPTPEDWNTLLEQKPGLGLTVLATVVALAGVFQKAEAKKF